MQQNADTPVTIARGAEAVRGELSRMFSAADADALVYGVCNIDLVKEHFPEWSLSGADPSRAVSGLHSKFIYTSYSGPELEGTDRLYNRDSRYLEREFSINMTVIGSTVLFVTTEDGQPAGYTITSEGLAKDMISMFDLLWEQASA